MRLTWRGKEWGTEKWKKMREYLQSNVTVLLVGHSWKLRVLQVLCPLHAVFSICRQGQCISWPVAKVYKIILQTLKSVDSFSCQGLEGKTTIFFYISVFFLHLAARGNHNCKRWSRAGDMFGLPSQSNEWKRNDWLLKWMNKCTNSSTAV